jgi:hypothetical protein
MSLRSLCSLRSLYVKKLRGCELRQFKLFLDKPALPLEYLYISTCYGIFDNDELVAGYALAHVPLARMFAISQIPKNKREHFGNEDPFKYVEFAGYFVKDKKYVFRLLYHLAMQLLFHKASCTVYSYPTYDLQMERICRVGSPLRIYSDKPEGNSLVLPESVNVEILSKWGVFKICVVQLLKRAVL